MRTVALVITIFLQAVMTITLIYAPKQFYQVIAPVPVVQHDFGQFVTGWSSGYGVSEAIDYLKQEADTTPIIVLVRFDSGNPEDAIRLLLSDNERILVKTVLPNEAVLPQLRWYATAKVPVFFISRGSQLLSMDAYFREQTRFTKPFGEEFIGVYQLTMP